MEGATPFPLLGCVMAIGTTEDLILEGNHEFSLSVFDASPDDAVMFEPMQMHEVTIMDDDGMQFWNINYRETHNDNQ